MPILNFVQIKTDLDVPEHDMCNYHQIILVDHASLIDTYKSQLDDEKRVGQIEAVRTYLLNHCERLFDWWEIVADQPKYAGKPGPWNPISVI